MGWLEVILRFISFWLDKLIYGFVPKIYNIFMDIATTSIFTEEIFDTFLSKVYALLGIFMLFKVSFSILSYIVDPDAFLDKSKGFSKLIGNIIITLTLLITTPWIFSQAMEIQQIILKDDIIAKIFSTTGVSSIDSDDSGNAMAYETFKAFYHLDYDVFTACKDDNNNFSDTEECKEQLGLDNNEYDSLKQNMEYSSVSQNIDVYMDPDMLLLESDNGVYVMAYIPIISTIAGIALLLLLIVFCFDVALRSVKLGFLRMIAPVPIISRIDPKKGKETFDKWLKSIIGTYLDLFIRLLAIYFAIFVITQVIDLKFVDAATGLSKDVDALVKVFIILGALLFAKQVPQLVQDLTGIKMDGKFTLNPLKKLTETGVPGLAAVGGAAFGSAISNFAAAKTNGDDPTIGRRLRSAVGGFGGGLVRGGSNFVKTKGEKPGEIFTKSITESSNARRLRESGYGVKDKVMDYMTSIAGAEYDTGTTSKLKNDINQYKEVARNAREEETQARNELRDFRSKLGAAKSSEIQKLLMNRKYQTDEYGKVKRDDNGMIMYSQDLPEDYAAYRASNPTTTLTRENYEDLQSYINMIDTADGAAFVAEKAVKKAEEKSGLSKKQS